MRSLTDTDHTWTVEVRDPRSGRYADGSVGVTAGVEWDRIPRDIEVMAANLFWQLERERCARIDERTE